MMGEQHRLGDSRKYFVSDLEDICPIDAIGWDSAQNPRVGSSGQRDLENSTIKVKPEIGVKIDVLNSFKG